MKIVDLENKLDVLREQGALRVATIRAQVRASNQAIAIATRYVGVDSKKDDEATRKAKWAKASRLVKHLKEGGDPLHPIAFFVITTSKNIEALETIRKTYEAAMLDSIKGFPAFKWWKSIRGLAELGFATILAETGNLSDYPSPSHVWKRLGLAPKTMYKMEKKNGAEGHAIPKRRRSVVWNVGDALIKQNKGQNKEDGYYRKLYLERKAYEHKHNPHWEAEGKKLQAHRRAQRYMEKRLLKHLWQKWNKQAIED